jgi:signal transduction histidine kinase
LSKLITEFIPAVRSSTPQILCEHELVLTQRFFTDLFDSISGIGAVINQNRQIVYANSDFLHFLGLDSLVPILGKRAGEVISCVHSNESTGGCGTSNACSYCGAVQTFFKAQTSGKKVTGEARITTIVVGKLNYLDLKVTVSPVNLNGRKFYAIIFQDISVEKRQLVLEKIFFHDILNSATGLFGLLSLLKNGTAPDSDRKLIALSEDASRDIIEEIIMQKQVRSAEIGDLTIKIETLNSIELLTSTIGKIFSHKAIGNKLIVLSEKTHDVDFQSDKGLLQRVLINLIKNAVEATIEGGKIVIGVEDLRDKLRFWIANKGVMTDPVQMQLFQYSFSTKGTGRGTGTYSVKLLTENYLNGKISFESNDKTGTVFSVILNKKFI